jgi:DNA-binding MarR family transcriptional regulator
MALTRETAELLAEAARAWYFEDDQQGLRNRELMALRFLARANRFSRTPSALASFIGSTKATATQLVKALEEQSYLVRTPSDEDKRSVMLCVTAKGEKYLAQHDPVNQMVSAIAALGAERCGRLRNALREILNNFDAHHRPSAGVCRDCAFLAEHAPNKTRQREASRFTCRRFRTPLSADEVGQLCTSFEPVQDRPRINNSPDKAREPSR